MINNTSNARSIELAERAKRLIHSSTMGAGIGGQLDDVAEQLTNLDNSDRYYFAQSELEKNIKWTNEVRALAHEMNTEDSKLRKIDPLSPQAMHESIAYWIKSYSKSTLRTTIDFANKLNDAFVLMQNNDRSVQSNGYSNLLAIIEQMLSSSHKINDDKIVDHNVITLRMIRDALLDEKELNVDLYELQLEEKEDDNQQYFVDMAREEVTDIFNGINIESSREILSDMNSEASSEE